VLALLLAALAQDAGVVREDGAVSLASDWSRWLPFEDPSAWDVVTGLAVLKGRLVASSRTRRGGSWCRWTAGHGRRTRSRSPA
jgi:hypothetical protein